MMPERWPWEALWMLRGLSPEPSGGGRRKRGRDEELMMQLDPKLEVVGKEARY